MNRLSFLMPSTLLLISLLSGCGGERENDNPVNSLDLALTQIADNSIIPSFKNSYDAALAFEAQANTFCSATNSSELAQLQTDWKQFSTEWNRTMLYNFGPMIGDSFFSQMLYIESKFLKGNDYTNDVRDHIRDAMADTTTLDQAYFDGLGISQVGILALESLSFETSDISPSQLPADILADYQGNARKCLLLQGMAGQVVKHINSFYQSWLNGYREEFLSGTLEDGTTSISELLTRAQGQLDYIKTRKLQATLDAAIADYAKQNLQATLNEARNLLFGVTDKTTYSLIDHMRAGGYTQEITTVTTNLNYAQAKLDELPASLKGQDLTDLAAAIGTLDGNFKREIPNSLDVTLGINFNDGD